MDDGDIGSFDGQFPSEDEIADGTDQCVCAGPGAGALDGALMACADANANAALRQQLNDMRVLGARLEGAGNADRAEATTAAQRDQMMTDPYEGRRVLRLDRAKNAHLSCRKLPRGNSRQLAGILASMRAGN